MWKKCLNKVNGVLFKLFRSWINITYCWNEKGSSSILFLFLIFRVVSNIPHINKLITIGVVLVMTYYYLTLLRVACQNPQLSIEYIFLKFSISFLQGFESYLRLTRRNCFFFFSCLLQVFAFSIFLPNLHSVSSVGQPGICML